MPNSFDNIGRSEYTEIKHSMFEGLMALHSTICESIIREHGGRYHYIELNAGRGESCAIAMGAIRPHVPEALFDFFEKHPSNAERLHDLFDKDESVRIVPGDHRKTAESHLARIGPGLVNGVLFHDPNGVPELELLERVSRLPSMQRVDLLLYVSATGLKRARTAATTGYRLTELVERVDKKHWLIGETRGGQQWTMLIGSNWANFPDWKKKGFHKINSREGKAIVEKADKTRKEQFDELQGRFRI